MDRAAVFTTGGIQLDPTYPRRRDLAIEEEVGFRARNFHRNEALKGTVLDANPLQPTRLLVVTDRFRQIAQRVAPDAFDYFEGLYRDGNDLFIATPASAIVIPVHTEARPTPVFNRIFHSRYVFSAKDLKDAPDIFRVARDFSFQTFARRDTLEALSNAGLTCLFGADIEVI